MTEPALREMTLEITQDCPNRCIYCSSVVGRNAPHPPLSVEVIRSLLGEAVLLGLRSLSLSGGEPFLHPRISEILTICSSLGLNDLKIYTSGVVRGDSGEVEPLNTGAIKSAKQAGATVIFNVQSIHGRVHDRLAGHEGRLSVALTSLKNTVNSGVAVECHFVPNKINLDSLFDTAHALVDMGVRRVSFLRLVRQGNAVDNWSVLGLDQQDLRKLDLLLSSLHSEPQSALRYRFGVPFSGISQSRAICQAGVSKILVRWDGLCFPCEAFKECGDDSFVVGDVHVSSMSQVLRTVRHSRHLQLLKCLSRVKDVCPAQMLYSTGEDGESGRN